MDGGGNVLSLVSLRLKELHSRRESLSDWVLGGVGDPAVGEVANDLSQQSNAPWVCLSEHCGTTQY